MKSQYRVLIVLVIANHLRLHSNRFCVLDILDHCVLLHDECKTEAE